MKKRIFLLAILLHLSIISSFGQQLCNTPAVTNNNLLNNSSFLRTSSNNNNYCLRVYFHVIRRSDGTGGQSTASVNSAFQLLNQDFNPHNISFSWNNVIDYINNTSYYNSPNANIFTVNNNSNGIDIYLYDDLAPAGGLANGVGGAADFYVAGKFWNSPFQSLVTSHVTSHEMGHVLFLWHTHHGTFNEGGNDNPCAELVNGTNASTCGDYVVDTPADPHIQFNVNSNCQWLGSGSDLNGQQYNPDEQNIMAYTIPQCMSYFTALQGLRMRNSISTLPYLQQCLTNSCCAATTADLYIKDSSNDNGTEPNNITQYMWTSDNIWVRNNNDSGLIHENPDYSANGNPNYVKVRVINKSCVTSTGNEQLKLYWAKASTGLSWPNPWNGGILEPVTNASMGQQIGTLTIPVLQAGQEAILTFPWQVPNPANYSQDQWHFCLLARIEATNDPMTSIETSDINANTRNNNNIAWKNVTVVDILPNNKANPGGVVAVANPFNQTRKFNLELVKDQLETGQAIFEEAEVTLKMDQILFDAWKKGGSLSNQLAKTRDEKIKIVTGDNVILKNITFNPKQLGMLNLKFNFLTKKLTGKSKFTYHVIQRDAITNKIIGGETYVIKKQARPALVANAGETKMVNKNEPITINASQISEPAIYNWYDTEGNLVFTGKDLTIATQVATKYKLEVIATADGFKDYSEVQVNIKPSTLNTIAPNPARNNVTIGYKLNEVGSAYLMVIGYYGINGTSNNYILDVNSNETNLNVSNYPSGFYTVALVVNGEIVDAKTLIKQ